MLYLNCFLLDHKFSHFLVDITLNQKKKKSIKTSEANCWLLTPTLMRKSLGH